MCEADGSKQLVPQKMQKEEDAAGHRASAQSLHPMLLSFSLLVDILWFIGGFTSRSAAGFGRASSPVAPTSWIDRQSAGRRRATAPSSMAIFRRPLLPNGVDSGSSKSWRRRQLKKKKPGKINEN